MARRWAAAYVAQVAARTPGDVRVLRGALGETDPSVRALILLGLLRNGDSDAIPRLIALLPARGYMANGEPPEPIADLVDLRLTLATHADFGFRSGEPAARARGIERWRDWWQRVRSRTRWDPGAHIYRWPGRPAGINALASSPAPGARAAAAGDPLVLRRVYEVTFDHAVGRAQRRAILRNFAAAERFLNGPGRTGRCTPVRFEIDVREAGDTPTPGAWQLLVDEVNWFDDPAYRRSYVAPQFERGRLWTSQVIDPGYGTRVIAHETVHTFGLHDEYRRDPRTGRTTPIDPTSFLGDGINGDVLQRHLDALVEGDPGRSPPDACERWVLEARWTSVISPWRQEGRSSVTHHLGLSAAAVIDAPFWLDPATGVITPAGRLQCGRTLLYPQGGPCAESSREGRLTRVATDPGGGRCAHAVVRRTDRFPATVSGAASGGALRLRLAVADSERAFFNCSPPADGGDTRDFELIANGMRWAGARDFTVALRADGTQTESRAFERSGEHRRASGSAGARRCQPTGC